MRWIFVILKPSWAFSIVEHKPKAHELFMCVPAYDQVKDMYLRKMCKVASHDQKTEHQNKQYLLV
jgi:3-methyladenine DNA glycosylase AlkC